MQKLLAHKLEEMAVPQRDPGDMPRVPGSTLLGPSRLDGDEFDRALRIGGRLESMGVDDNLEALHRTQTEQNKIEQQELQSLDDFTNPAYRAAYENYKLTTTDKPPLDLLDFIESIRDTPRANPGVDDSRLKLLSESQRVALLERLNEKIKENERRLALEHPKHSDKVLRAIDEVVLPELIREVEGKKIANLEKVDGPDRSDLIKTVENMFKETSDNVIAHIIALRDLAVAARQYGEPERIEMELDKIRRTSNNLVQVNTFMVHVDEILTLSSTARPAEKNYVRQMRDFIRLVDDNLSFIDITDIDETLAKESDLHGKFCPKLLKLIITEYLEMLDVVSGFMRTNEVYDLYHRRFSKFEGVVPSGLEKGPRYRIAPGSPKAGKFSSAKPAYRKIVSADEQKMNDYLASVLFRIVEILNKFFPRVMSGNVFDGVISQTERELNAQDRRALKAMLNNDNEPFALMNFIRKGRINDKNISREFLRLIVASLDEVGDAEFMDATEAQLVMDKVLAKIFVANFNLQAQLFTDPGGLTEALSDARQDLTNLARRTRERIAPAGAAIKSVASTLKDRFSRGA